MTSCTRTSILASLILSVALTFGCGGSQQAPAEQAKPAEPAAAADVAGHMHEHMARVTTMQDAVIRGDVEAAVEPARWVADHQETAGLPAGTESIVADMKKSAAVVAEAGDFKHAATATAMVISYCGTCHAAAKASPSIPEAPKAEAKGPLTAHMLEHQWATELMYQGLVMPSEERWKKGLAAMQHAPLAEEGLPKDAKLTKDVIALEKRVHEMAAKAGTATDIGTKVAFYGEYIAGCAGCHELHGKVWGPGLPKVQ